MRILFLNTPLKKEKISRDMAGGLGFDATNQTLLPPIDFAYLAAILKKEKKQVKIVDPEAEKLETERVIREIILWKPDVIIASVSLPSLSSDIEFIRNLKNIYRGKIITKTSITHNPILEKILKESMADFCIWSESDLEIGKIIAGKSFAGTAVLEDGRLVVRKPARVDNLDLLPFAARNLLQNEKYRYPLLGKNCTIMQTSRGCPFPCAYYCPYPLVQGKKWRAMSAVRVYEELAQIVKRFGINNVLFRDATFTLDRQRTAEICQKIIEEKLKFDWWCETRINCLDGDLLKMMKKAGCQGINIGVETGDPVVMEIQGKPGVSLAQLEKIKKAADSVGIKLHFLLLIGLPKENKQSLYLTFKLIKRLNPYSLGVTVVTPYPGTKLYEEAKQHCWIETEDWTKYSGNLATMHTEFLSSGEMKIGQKLLQGELFLLKSGYLGKLVLFFEDLFFRFWSAI